VKEIYNEIELLKLIDQIAIQKDHEYVRLDEINNHISQHYHQEIGKHLHTLLNLGVIKTAEGNAGQFQIAGVTPKLTYQNINNDVAKMEDIKEWLNTEWSKFPKNQT
jgi:hypothetical protein